MTDKRHSYSLRLDWTGNEGTGTSAYRAYSWQSTFRNRRDFGDERHALGSADAEHLNLSGPVGWQTQSDAYDHGVADKVVERWAAPR